jgi:hypothetical protein
MLKLRERTRLNSCTAVCALVMALSTSGSNAACNFTRTGTEPDGGTNGTSIRLIITRNINLGTFTRPDPVGGGGAVEDVILRPDGTRTLPPTLTIRSDETNPARMPFAATAEVTGGANCGFEVVIGATTQRLVDVKLEGDTPYAFGFTGAVRARGRLDGTGRFRFRIGVIQRVRSGNTFPPGGTIELTANYRNAP